jgi:hypothetical protein
MSIIHLQRPRLVVVGNGMAGMRTVGEGDKIYHTAEKLFPLARSTPVGIMTYGSADLIGVRRSRCLRPAGSRATAINILLDLHERSRPDNPTCLRHLSVLSVAGSNRHDTTKVSFVGFVGFCKKSSVNPDVARRFECVRKLNDHAAIIAAFHFLRQPSRPGAARPPTNPRKCILM